MLRPNHSMLCFKPKYILKTNDLLKEPALLRFQKRGHWILMTNLTIKLQEYWANRL